MPENLFTTTAQISPRPPFDFDKTLNFVRGFSPAYGDQTANDGILTKATRLNGQTLVFSAQSSGAIDAPALQVTLTSTEPLNEENRQAALERIRFYLSVDDDLLPFYALAQDDPNLAPIVNKLYGYHQLKFLTPFENAVWAILSSRNRHPNAVNAKRRIIAAHGGSLVLNGVSYAAFPEPLDLLGASPDELLGYVRQQYRADFLRSVIWAFAHIDDEWLKAAPYDEVYTWLRGINGIGAWSAEFIMLRGLGRMERLTTPDTGMLNVFARCYAEPADAKNVLNVAKRYGDYQGCWAHYLRAGG